MEPIEGGVGLGMIEKDDGWYEEGCQGENYQRDALRLFLIDRTIRSTG